MPEPFTLELSPAARRDLQRLPLSVQKDIVFEHLPAIEEYPFSKSRPLFGALKGERSYHFGRKPEYRIIFYVEENIVTVTIIGTRESIYKRAKRRK
jgi:mRNA-degrading endonuclease RelE of RelBE toxin-antitoxin system